MGDIVFANGNAILHKGSAGKSMAAMPDVCLCPPPAPTGPIPTPLPNNSMASDIDGCAKSVLIEGNPAGTKDSFFKTSTGNEPSKPTGGGVVSHAVKGKTYFIMGSMDVLIEGVGAVRHLDTGTHNHNSQTGNTPPWVALAAMHFKPGGKCAGNAEGCKLVPYKKGCPGGKTPHHAVPSHCFVKAGKRAANIRGEAGTCITGASKYKTKDAPCVCATGASWHTKSSSGKLLQHGRIHRRVDLAEAVAAKSGGWDLGAATDAGAKSVVEVIPGCTEACIAAQLDAYHVKQCGMKKSQPVRSEVASKALGKEADAILAKAKKAATVF